MSRKLDRRTSRAAGTPAPLTAVPLTFERDRYGVRVRQATGAKGPPAVVLRKVEPGGARYILKQGRAYFDIASRGKAVQILAGGLIVDHIGTELTVGLSQGHVDVAVHKGAVTTRRLERVQPKRFVDTSSNGGGEMSAVGRGGEPLGPRLFV